jgi:hypothetical protein
MMKFLFFALGALCLIHYGECGVIATANLHFDSSTEAAGALIFEQRQAHGPVRIVGILDGLSANTVHVGQHDTNEG